MAALSALHAPAKRAGTMLLPGVGFDVVPSDCLCAHVARRLGQLRTLRIAISGLELASPGSLKTLVNELGRQTRVVTGGTFREVAPGELTRSFDFGAGQRMATAVSWGDLVTAPLTTGANHVETYFEQTPAVAAVVQANRQFSWMYRLPWVQDALARTAPRMSGGPTAEEMTKRRAAIVVEAEAVSGARATSRMVTPEAYTPTAATSHDISARGLAGDCGP